MKWTDPLLVEADPLSPDWRRPALDLSSAHPPLVSSPQVGTKDKDDAPDEDDKDNRDDMLMSDGRAKDD